MGLARRQSSQFKTAKTQESILNQAPRDSQLVKGLWGLPWSCVCIDKHIAFTKTVYFKGVSCFTNKLLTSFVQKLLCSLSGQHVAVCQWASLSLEADLKRGPSVLCDLQVPDFAQESIQKQVCTKANAVSFSLRERGQNEGSLGQD